MLETVGYFIKKVEKTVRYHEPDSRLCGAIFDEPNDTIIENKCFGEGKDDV